ncbi:hypothetical protein ACS0TY_010955 [Phlomoides rotata]
MDFVAFHIYREGNQVADLLSFLSVITLSCGGQLRLTLLRVFLHRTCRVERNLCFVISLHGTLFPL